MNDQAENEVAEVKSNVPANAPANAFQAIAASAPRRIVGKLLKFNKGDWVYGEDNEELDIGTKLIANMDQLLTGWIRWFDNKPQEQRMGLVVEGYVPPKREELGFLDKDEWELDDRNQPRDPWQKTWYLVMRQLDKDGEPMKGEEGLFTFTTSSVGGNDLIAELCKFFGKLMAMHPDDYPIVKIVKPRKYAHSNKAYGDIKVPVLETSNSVKGWINKSEFGDLIETEMDDSEDIPF